MTWLGTRETREARFEAQQADSEEREHRRGCIDCIRAVRQRKPGDRCAEGRQLAGTKQETARRYAEEHELDKAPIHGQASYSRRHYAEVFGKGGHGVPIPKNVRHSGL